MMRVAKRWSKFDSLRQLFPDFQNSVGELESRVADDSNLYRIWFDASGNRPALFARFGDRGESKTIRVILIRDR